MCVSVSVSVCVRELGVEEERVSNLITMIRTILN